MKTTRSLLYICALVAPLLSACGPGLGAFLPGVGGGDNSTTSAFCRTTATHTHFHSGSGTVPDPFMICTADQFAVIGNHQEYWGDHFKLADDIDMAGYDASSTERTLLPIGFYDAGTPGSSVAFTGSFDGDGHTLAHLTMSIPSSTALSYGPFGYVSVATIQNLRLNDISIVANGLVNNVGLLTGRALNSSFDGIQISGELVKATGSTGCWTNCGGMIGYGDATAGTLSVINSSVAVQLDGINVVGGFAGKIFADGGTVNISNVRSSGDIYGKPGVTGTGGAATAGGFIGYIELNNSSTATLNDTISFTNWTASHEPAYSGSPNSFSGLYIGTAEAKSASILTVLRCGASGTLKSVDSDAYGGQYLGGLFGIISTNAATSAFTIDQCYSKGTVHVRTPTQNRSVHGGISGQTSFTNSNTTNYFRDVYSQTNLLYETTGTVGLASPAFGRVSYTTSPAAALDATRVYSSGSFSVPNGLIAASVAGFIGSNGSANTTATASYYNSDTFAAGIGTGSAVAGASGLSAAGLQNSANFVGWDFTTVWIMDSSTNMPRLRNVPLQ
jgi:hypothetical protein